MFHQQRSKLGPAVSPLQSNGWAFRDCFLIDSYEDSEVMIGKYIDPEVDRTFQWLLREKKDWEAAMASNEEKREQRWKYTYGVNKCSANLMRNLKLLH